MFSTSTIPALLLVAAAVCDLRTREIPDAIPLALCLVGAGFAIASGGGAAALAASAMAAGVFAVGLALFRLGQLGGGDVKLMAATMFWLPPSHAPDFLVATAIAGGAICLTVAAARFLSVSRAEGFGPALAAARSATAPYGLAIAAGGLAALPWGGVPS